MNSAPSSAWPPSSNRCHSTRPPIRSRASSTATECPSFASAHAVARPAAPAPITIAPDSMRLKNSSQRCDDLASVQLPDDDIADGSPPIDEYMNRKAVDVVLRLQRAVVDDRRIDQVKLCDELARFLCAFQFVDADHAQPARRIEFLEIVDVRRFLVARAAPRRKEIQVDGASAQRGQRQARTRRRRLRPLGGGLPDARVLGRGGAAAARARAASGQQRAQQGGACEYTHTRDTPRRRDRVPFARAN